MLDAIMTNELCVAPRVVQRSDVGALREQSFQEIPHPRRVVDADVPSAILYTCRSILSTVVAVLRYWSITSTPVGHAVCAERMSPFSA
jgi:hypothetical protein